MVLVETLLRGPKKVPKDEAKKAVERFIDWTTEMQQKGMFGGCESVPPKLNDFNTFMKQAAGYLEQTTVRLKVGGRVEKWKNRKAAGKAERFLTDCQCFLGEVKLSIQSSSSVQSTCQMPETHKTEKTTTQSKVMSVQTPTAPATPPYAEA